MTPGGCRTHPRRAPRAAQAEVADAASWSSIAARDGEPDAVPGVVEVALEIPDPLGALGLGASGRVPGADGELAWSGADLELGLPESPSARAASVEERRGGERLALVQGDFPPLDLPGTAGDRIAAGGDSWAGEDVAVAWLADDRVDGRLAEREAVLGSHLRPHPRGVEPVRARLEVVRRRLTLHGDRREPLDAPGTDVAWDEDPQRVA